VTTSHESNDLIDQTGKDQLKTLAPNKLFYGWIIVGVAGLLQFAGGTETFPVIGIFQQPMINEFGWSRLKFSAPMTIGTILGGILGLGVGPWMDRHGARGVMSLAGITLGAVFVLMGSVQSLWQHYVLQALARTITAGAFFMVVSIIIPKWFVAKRGRATAYAGMGGRLGHIVLPLFAQKVIAVANWRTAWISMGILIWTLAVIPVLLFFRRTPEDMGLLPDGAKEINPSYNRKSADNPKEVSLNSFSNEVSFGPREVMRTRAFYCILLAQALLAFVISGTHFHWFSYLTGMGISESDAVATMAVSPLAGIPMTLLAGFLSERFHVRYILIVAYLGFGATMFILVNISTTQMAYIFGIALGATSGVTFTVSMIVWADYYGRGSIGAIRGLTAPIQMTTNALGPLVAALTFDLTGSYGLIFWAFVFICLASSGLWLLATRPEKTFTMNV
jgi:sugar phosphate permease